MVQKISVNKNEFARVSQLIDDLLNKAKVNERKKREVENAVEEAFAQITGSMNATDEEIKVEASMLLGRLSVNMSAGGGQLEQTGAIENFVSKIDTAEADEIVKAASINIIRAYTDSFKFGSKNGVNSVKLQFVLKRVPSIVKMIVAILLGFGVGALLKYAVNPEIAGNINSYLFEPLRKMFIDALKMVAVPVVFFSLASCIAGFADLKSLGRVGFKIIGLYMITTVLAIVTGTGFSFLFKPGSEAFVADIGEVAIPADKISIIDMITGIVPSNFVSAFTSGNMLQVMFLAIFVGIGVGAISDKNDNGFKDALDKINKLFLWITTVIVKFAPIAVFCGIASLMVKTGIDALISLGMYFITFVVSLVAMVMIYMVVVAVAGHLNPFVFIRKYAPSMLATFSLSSSNASLPINLKACTKDMGVNPRIASFSIPLGATINMDGSSIYLMVSILFLSKCFGITISPAMLLTIGISAFIFSIGQPGVTGGAFICLSALAVQVGLPVEALSILIGIDPIMSMFRTCSNCAGDVAVTVTVANSEKQLNKSVYYGK